MSQETPTSIRMYHVTALSNLARAYEPYSRTYDKSRLPKCRFPGQFFLLREDELSIGVKKAAALVRRLALPGDALLVLATQVRPGDLQANTRTGLGQWVAGDAIRLDAVYGLKSAHSIGGKSGIPQGSEAGPVALQAMPVEEAMARSLACLNPVLAPHAALRPRSVSILPIARACQAACRFCFSEASVSSEQQADRACLSAWSHACAQARARGAERFVITGGGEPGLLPHADMLDLIRTGRRHFAKGVLISNGVHLARLDEGDRQARLRDYAAAGLSTLAISRHHADPAINAQIMGLDTRTERVLNSREDLYTGQQYASFSASKQQFLAENCLKIRLICVLQKGGVDSLAALGDYLNWAAAHGVRELCFKELYVSTTLASRYHAAPENAWSHAQQVPLAWLMQSLQDWGFDVVSRLPWGAPVFSGEWTLPDGRRVPLKIAAYTEPTVFWERSHGMARSWNLMADGTCLASLEDPDSQVPVQVPALKTSAPVAAAEAVSAQTVSARVSQVLQRWAPPLRPVQGGMATRAFAMPVTVSPVARVSRVGDAPPPVRPSAHWRTVAMPAPSRRSLPRTAPMRSDLRPRRSGALA